MIRGGSEAPSQISGAGSMCKFFIIKIVWLIMTHLSLLTLIQIFEFSCRYSHVSRGHGIQWLRVVQKLLLKSWGWGACVSFINILAMSITIQSSLILFHDLSWHPGNIIFWSYISRLGHIIIPMIRPLLKHLPIYCWTIYGVSVHFCLLLSYDAWCSNWSRMVDELLVPVDSACYIAVVGFSHTISTR